MISDLVIVGGGITGLGIARLATRNGLSATVIERGDLASGTSSASSHMLHGGLRYLEQGRFTLVRESLEQRMQVARMAPHLVAPVRFMAPVYRGDRVGPLKLKLGLSIYDGFAGRNVFSPHTMVRPVEARALEPGLAVEGLRGSGLYTDVVMDDAQLAIAVARDAAAHGAVIRTYTEFTTVRPAGDGTYEIATLDRIDGTTDVVRARAIVNAAGPWSDHVRTALFRSLAPGHGDPAPLLSPSRGIHLVFPALTRGHALVLTARTDGRVFFVVPFGGMSLVGTTEVEVPAPPPPDAWRATVEEIRYLRSELTRALPGVGKLPPRAVLSGLRPLLKSNDEVGSASREHRVIHEHGVTTVAGGKYTTFRVIARDALACVIARLGRTSPKLSDPADRLPSPVAPGAPVEELAAHAVEHEFARRVADVIRRRSRLWLEPDRGRAAATRAAAVMAQRLGWDAERARQEFQAYDASLWDEESLLTLARDA